MINESNYVLIIGSSNMDLNIYSKRLPTPGETVTGGTFKQFLGGKGANQAVASARSGAKTIFIGKIGTDSYGDEMISQLAKEGINMDYILRDPKISSGVAFILIDEKGENMISVAPGANSLLILEEIRFYAELIKKAKILVVQLEIPMETIREIFIIASEGNVIKILNPAPLKPIHPDLFKLIDIIIPNKGELFQLFSFLGFRDLEIKGKQKILEILKSISTFGLKYIITTLGNKGSIIYSKDDKAITEISSPKVKAIDTVGAGDCFIGVFAGKLSVGENVVNAVKYATIAASIAVTRRGAQKSMPFLKEIEAKFKEIYN